MDRVVLYTRVSTDEQARSGFSLPEQTRTLRQHAERSGWEIVEEVSDPGNSGADPFRPGIRRLAELAETGKVDVVLSWKRDRLFRSIVDRRNFEQDLAEYGVRAVSLNDTGSRVGDKIMDVLSEEEREQIKDRTRAGKLGKARRGLMPGGNQVHFGFRFAGGKAERYEVDEAKMALVERIFRMVGAEGCSLTSVKRAFESEGIPSPRGGKYWSTTTLRRIVENNVYLARPAEEVAELVAPEVVAGLGPELLYGVYWFGRVRMHRNYGRGSTKFTVEHNDREEWVAIPVPDCGVPPGWVIAARKRVANRVRHVAKPRRAWTLRGRVRCGCGYATLAWGNGKGHFYYVCGQHRRRGPCPEIRYHPAAETEGRVERFVLGLINDPETLREKVEEKASHERTALLAADKEARRAHERLAKLEIMEDGYSAQQAEGLITMARLREKLGGLAGERATLEKRLAELRDSGQRLRELERLPGLVEEYLRDLPYLIGREPVIREYETVPEPRTPSNPLGVFTVTPERVRFLSEKELAERRRTAETERAARLQSLYEMLDLRVTAHKDGVLEVTWGLDCHRTLGRG